MRQWLNLISSKTIKQSCAAGAYQAFLSAISGCMGGCPGYVAAAMTVVVPNLGATFSGTGPVAARMITRFPWEVGGAVVF